MRKSAATPIAVACFVFAASCHRPIARYQPIPVERFTSVTPATTQRPAVDPVPEPEPPVVPLGEPVRKGASGPEALASTAGRPRTNPSQQVRQHLHRVTGLLRTPSSPTAPESRASESRASEQPRPKPKTGQKKTLREILGLKPRKKLNWWQRIPWQLKAAIPVIAVALVFAIFKIAILAIIFGLLGAFLLIRGLKKSFRVRRPWF
ncbi:hypothetical protein [Larkinella soli]|uniref:hypothetical protein n=1 Tax=Larkinella soli TaxID=1770527 RepID=UPI000FFB711B|nr:hypothetical protein [Larkinella soli]